MNWDYANFLTDLNLNRADEVIKAGNKAEQLDPSDSALRLSDVYSRVRRYDQAAEHARRAIKENTNPAWAHGFLAEACVRQGKFAEAINERRKALELSLGDDRGRALIDLAITLAQSGQKEEARKHLDETTQARRHPVHGHHGCFVWDEVRGAREWGDGIRLDSPHALGEPRAWFAHRFRLRARFHVVPRCV